MLLDDPGLWKKALAYLRRNHSDICRQWFEELEPLSLEGGLLEIRVNSEVQRRYLQSQCRHQFMEAVQQSTGALLTVKFVGTPGETRDAKPTTPPQTNPGNPGNPGNIVNPSQPATGGEASEAPAPLDGSTPAALAAGGASEAGAAAGAAARAGEPIVLPDGMVLSPDHTFSNFVSGPGNRLAMSASIGVAEKPGKAYNPLFIHGGSGVGKTHLLQAICQEVLRRFPDFRILYLSCEEFVNQFMDSIQNSEMKDFRHKFRDLDMLLIDDIHLLTNRERTQEEFFHTFNTLYQLNRQVVLSSDSSPNEIPQLEERLVSRFNWGLVARIDRPCYETRVAILKKKAAMRGIDMPMDVVNYIAGRIESNTRELEGAITRVDTLASLRHVPITLDLAQEALEEGRAPQTATQLTIQSIIDAVTSFFGVKLADMQSKKRHRSITIPRQVCMYLARKHTRYSLEEIGGYFGGRDHTTVMHADEITRKRMVEDPQFASQITHLDTLLGRKPGAPG